MWELKFELFKKTKKFEKFELSLLLGKHEERVKKSASTFPIFKNVSQMLVSDESS